MKKIIILVLFIVFAISNNLQAQSDYYTVLNGGSTSKNGRAPQGGHKCDRSVWLVTQTEMTAAGFANGDVINSLGFVLSASQNIATTGSFVVYMQNTADVTNTKSTTWATAISGMTTVSNATITVPNTIGTFDHTFSGGSTFTYTGGGLYIAFDFQYTGTLATTLNTALCDISLSGGVLTGFSTTTPLPTLIAPSNFRPNTRLGKSVTCARPDGLGATSNYTTTTAEVTWKNVTGGGTVELEYGPYNFTRGTGTIVTGVTSPYTITGLTASTSYDFYIRTNCGSGNFSTWNGPYSFHTSFLPANPTYNTGFEVSDLPLIGWLATPSSNFGDWFTYYAGVGNTNVQEGAYSCFALSNSVAVSNGRLYSRGIDLVANNPVTITYYDRNYLNGTPISTNSANYVLSVGTAQTVASQTTTLATIIGLSRTTYALRTYTFRPPTDGVYYFSFLHNSPINTTGVHGVIIDNFTVSQSPNVSWNGLVSSNWNDIKNWIPSVLPIASDIITIPSATNNPIISGSGYNAFAGTLTILNGGILNVSSGNSITVTDYVNVDSGGVFQLENNSSLVQINNVANTGNITYKRDANVRDTDYVYWSSPVAGFVVNNIPSPLTFSRLYTWDTTAANGNGGIGDWVGASGSTMLPAKGYIAKSPSSFTNTPSILNGSFTGVPNNGNIPYTVLRGNYTDVPYNGTNGTQITNLDDNHNLIGNPYPSAIRASQFLFDNKSTLLGLVMLWKHGLTPSTIYTQPFYNSYAYNYSITDYLTYNFTGTSCCPAAGSDLFIGAGQGFFVQMIDGPAASGTINFNNNLRNASYSNSGFYKNTNLSNNVTDIERNRIWLDLVSPTNDTYRTLVGYIEGATNNYDNLFDAPTTLSHITQIYSEINNNNYEIQGRQLPFDTNDEIPIGVYVSSAGNQTIALASVDGLFTNPDQNIYLKDNELNIIHDLKQAPYIFSAAVGDYPNRFVLKFSNDALGVNTNNLTAIKTEAFINNEKLIAKANSNIKKIDVYDINGKLINSYKPATLKTTFEGDFHFATGIYIGKITLENDMVFTQKLMN